VPNKRTEGGGAQALLVAPVAHVPLLPAPAGIIVGPLSITHYGEMKITNHTTGEECSLHFSKRSFWDSGPDPRAITGELRAPDGTLRYALQGSWDFADGRLSARRCLGPPASESEAIELFRVKPRPVDSNRQYEFTQFAIGEQRVCARARARVRCCTRWVRCCHRGSDPPLLRHRRRLDRAEPASRFGDGGGDGSGRCGAHGLHPAT
jgi:hypothetical protein